MPRLNRFQKMAPLSAANATSSALSPAAKLTTAERAVFNAIVTRNGHLQAGDALLVTIYAQQAARCLRESRNGDVATVDKVTRTMLALARSLRLTPQALQDPKGAFRNRGTSDLRKPWDDNLDDDEADDGPHNDDA